MMKDINGKQLVAGLIGVTLFYFIFSFFYHPTIIADPKKEEPTLVEENSEQGVVNEPTDSDISQLKQKLGELFEAQSDGSQNLSFVLVNQSGEEMVAQDQETTYQMAQTFYPLLAYVALNNMQEGNSSYFTETGQTDEDVTQMILDMMQGGDGEVASILASIVGYDHILDDLHAIGLTSFDIDPVTGDQIRINSKHLAHFFAQLNDGDLLNIQQTDHLLDQIKQSKEFFSTGYSLPKQVELIHQDGMSESGHFHDAGIIAINDQHYYYALMTYGESSELSEQRELIHSIWSLMMEHL